MPKAAGRKSLRNELQDLTGSQGQEFEANFEL